MTPELPRNSRSTGRLPKVPNQPKTPHKSFRIDPELYKAAQKKAKENGENLSEVVRRALTAYTESPATDGGEVPGTQ